MKEQKSPAEGRFYSFQAVTEGGDRLKRRGEQASLAGLPSATVFALCGARLKALP
ncbi:MAG: hypothetical protein IJD70_00585 [Clostridia bacterium]|nr:hypothetical protein [Clostridia bacterium]